MRERGQICCSCKAILKPEPTKERYCSRCDPKRIRVLMHFMLVTAGWRVTFLEADCKTSLPRKFVFQDSAKVMEMAMRGGADRMSADKQALEYGFAKGRGSVWLNLSQEQLEKLR